MKKRILMLISMVIMGSSALMAQGGYDYKQDPKYGNTPEEREHNVAIFNYFNDAYQMKTWDNAIGYLRELMANCPQASENIFIKGGEIYRNKLSRARSKADMMKALDSMMIIYDARVITYGDNEDRGASYILGRKAMDFYVYAPAEYNRAFGYFRDAVNAAAAGRGAAMDAEVAKVFINALTEHYKLGDITPDQYMNDYELTMEALGKATTAAVAAANAEKTAEYAAATEMLEALFAQSGAASCENIEKIYRPKYEADPTNLDLMKKIAGLLSRTRCTNDFALSFFEKYYQVDPKPEVAVMLAGIYEETKNFPKALEYITIAINNETNATLKYNYTLRAAAAYLATNNYRAAAEWAQKAIALDPNGGFGYFFYANALLGGTGSACSGFDRQAAYWLVVDALLQARSKSTDAAQLTNINNMIGSCSANFPKTEEVFMRGMAPGQGYTVNCGWISGRTTVRER